MSTANHVRTFYLDGQPITASGDETILDVARQHNVFIPTLCHFDGLTEAGACRLCLVEVKGSFRPLPACATRISEGMEVSTQSEALTEIRRTVLELLFAEGNHICSVCVSNGHCELQYLAEKVGLDHLTMPYRYPTRPVDSSHSRFILDRNRCVLCTRCVRVCEEVEHAKSWDIAGRGIKARVVTDLNLAWGETDFCTSCGKCVQVCPTGALVAKGSAVGEMVKQPRPIQSSLVR
jgi:bidirectional [NiFe] hydrogenase diaphorase subunit